MAGAALARAAGAVRRFFKQAAASDDGAILLDGKPVRTPAGAPLQVSAPLLAEAIVVEWNGQGNKVDPRSMPLTGLANAAIDRVVPDPATFAARLALFGETDLLCYRAETPTRLVERQQALWDPFLFWARRRFDVEFQVTKGIVHRSQPAAAIDRMNQAVQARSPFELAGLSPLVTVSGSLLIALAMIEGETDLESGWAAATLDEQWQLETWGEDREARIALDARRRDFEAADRFLRLLA